MKKKILLVDDEPDLVKSVKRRLEACGYEVVVAQDGEAGLEAAVSLAPDLIILDVMLPKRNGIEICAFLKKNILFSKIPVIIFTAKSGGESKEAAREAGADAYVVKPFDKDVFMAQVHRLLGEQVQQDEGI